MSSRTAVSTLVTGMFLTGCANSLLTKYQDKQCVENCDAASPDARIYFEQPVWQTLNMFIGELGCGLVLLAWKYHVSPRKPARPETSMFTRILARASLRTGAATTPAPVAAGYERVGDEGSDDEELMDDGELLEDADESGHLHGHGHGHGHGQGKVLEGWAMCWMWFPAFLDICGTTLMNVGLILTPVSIYQMSRGALVLWVGILSVIFLRRSLWLYQWTALIIVTLGVCLVGLSGSLVKKAVTTALSSIATTATAASSVAPAPAASSGSASASASASASTLTVALALRDVVARADTDPAKVALGVTLILFAQIFTASQYVIEERIMSHYEVEPLLAVALEGFFGLTTTLLAMPLLHVFLRHRSDYFDIPRGWAQIIGNPTVFWTCVAIAVSIGAFNFFGLSVTSRVSATTRSTIDTCRTLGIWIVSLGLGWEKLVYPFSLLQVAGFAMLVYGTFVFNGIIKPICFPPPPSVHLPNEPILEESGELPAAQGHVGYDVGRDS